MLFRLKFVAVILAAIIFSPGTPAVRPNSSGVIYAMQNYIGDIMQGLSDNTQMT